MKKFGGKRIARKIGGDDEDNGGSTVDSSQSTEPIVKRPQLAKSKKTSSSRLSFGPNQTSTDDNTTSTPKRSNLARLAVEHSASRLSSEHLPIRASLDTDRPSYSKDYLSELRKSQQSAPRREATTEDDSDTKALTSQTRELDIASKFGRSATSTTSAIPSATEIAEKKERRARLALEGAAGADDFISLDDPGDGRANFALAQSDDDEFRPRDTLTLPEKEKYAETRLVRDDEDVAEGFDDYVEDGKLELGRAALRDAERRRRAEMQEMINTAEGHDEDSVESDESEAERNAAYEAVQTRRGGVRKREQDGDPARTPPRITPIPELGAVIRKLKAAVEDAERLKQQKVRRLAEVRRERADINEREVWLQQQLKEAGERFERLRADASAPTPVPQEQEDEVIGGDESEESDAKHDDTDEGHVVQDDLRGVLLGNGLGGASMGGMSMRAPSPDW